MFLSASRRTDIPSYYGEWFVNRIKAGYVYIRNPINKKLISKVDLNPKVIDGIVFWTKNSKPFQCYLDDISDYDYYFQYTVNPYDKNIEQNVPNKKEIIDDFLKLSNRIGKNRVIWRYDPIIFFDAVDLNYHKKYFNYLAEKLSMHTAKCIISFIDIYKKCERNMKKINLIPFDNVKVNELSYEIMNIAEKYNLKIETCGEPYDLEKFGISHGKCIDERIFETLTGNKYKSKKDSSQRDECGCIESIDIGAYNTCQNNCIYCYANFNQKISLENRKLHDPVNPLLIGKVNEDDIIKNRIVKSFRQQKELF